jgi:hypothetical protein
LAGLGADSDPRVGRWWILRLRSWVSRGGDCQRGWVGCGQCGSPQVVGSGIAFAMNDSLSLVSDGAFCVSECAFTAGFTELAHGEQGSGS